MIPRKMKKAAPRPESLFKKFLSVLGFLMVLASIGFFLWMRSIDVFFEFGLGTWLLIVGIILIVFGRQGHQVQLSLYDEEFVIRNNEENKK